MGPVDDTHYRLDISTIKYEGAISTRPTGLITIAAYDTNTGDFTRLYGNDVLHPVNTPVPAEEDIRKQTKITVDIYKNGNWQSMPDFSVESQFAGLHPAGYVTSDTSIIGNVLNGQGSMDMQAYKDSTFRLTYHFNGAPFTPALVSTGDFDAQFAPNGWKYDAEAHSLQLYVKPVLYRELDRSYWNVFDKISQTGGIIEPELAGSTIAAFDARNTSPQTVTSGVYQAGVVSFFSSDAAARLAKPNGIYLSKS